MPSACVKIFVLAALVLVTACSGGRQAGNPLIAYAETDWQQLDSSAYQGTVRRISQAIDFRLPADPQQRDLGPQLVLSTGDGAAVLVARSSASEVLVARVNSSGIINYRQQITLGGERSISAIESVSIDGVAAPSIKITVAGDGAISTLYYALAAMQPQLLRTENMAGELSNSALVATGFRKLPLVTSVNKRVAPISWQPRRIWLLWASLPPTTLLFLICNGSRVAMISGWPRRLPSC